MGRLAVVSCLVEILRILVVFEIFLAVIFCVEDKYIALEQWGEYFRNIEGG